MNSKIFQITGMMLLLTLLGCSGNQSKSEEKYTLEVTASAYVTDSDRQEFGAWGDELKPETYSIAVSSDLIEMGITHNTKVTIEGREETYLVLDKMHPRWTRKIDVYMGNDRRKALQWGNKKIRISWEK